MSAEITKVLVTGASGYIATHVVQQLLKAGYSVRGTVRSLVNEQKVKPLKELCPDAAHPLELVEADLNDPECWDKAVEGCSHVMHTASPFPSSTPKDPEKEIIRPAVDGALNVLQACAKHQVKRVVLTSSIAAVSGGLGDPDKPDHVFSEVDWTNSDQAGIDSYVKSKTLAERAAWDFVEKLSDEERFELATINPGYVVGPVLSGSADATSMEIPRRLMQKELPMLAKLYMVVCDVRDVAQAHVNAMTIPEAAGNRHLVTSGGMWMKEMAMALDEEFKDQGYSIPMREAPNFLISVFGVFDASLKMIRPMLGITQKVDNTRLRTVLGIEPIDMKKSFVDMAYSMVDRGFIKRTSKYRPREQ
eukprot:GHVO01026547.1.p1 GENE.GHVO01026547.1~~GHVO01026547.1.p1  ORF type:complete len:397 (+),score=40.31 GHVO01026547.1:111-1193(+)